MSFLTRPIFAALLKNSPKYAQKREMTVISGPPKVRIGMGVKVLHGLIQSITYMVVPIIVISYIPTLREGPQEDEEC